MNIDFRENIMEIDGKVLVFPMSVEEVEGVLGKTDRVERESESCGLSATGQKQEI